MAYKDKDSHTPKQKSMQAIVYTVTEVKMPGL